jgi:hypothetical protein
MRFHVLRHFGLVGLIAAALYVPAVAGQKELEESVKSYRERYKLKDTHDVLVSNEGKGPIDLRGMRNFRAVLPGVVYRGGANNAFRHLYQPPPQPTLQKLANENPLPPEGLENLCKAGFSTAVYLYAKNMPKNMPPVTCGSADPQKNLTYKSIAWTSVDSKGKVNTQGRVILELVHAKLTGNDPRPIYLHCWNGWHASGLASALILRQFCEVSGEKAAAYWGGNIQEEYWKPTNPKNLPKDYVAIQEQIKNFLPEAKLTISKELKDLVCPQP